MLSPFENNALSGLLRSKSAGDYYEMGFNCAVYGSYPYYYRDTFPNEKMKMAYESGKKDGEKIKNQSK